MHAGLRTVTVHFVADVSDIDIDGTQADASTATDALNTVVILVHKIFQLMHKPLPNPMGLCSARIVAGTMQGKQRIHATVPVAHPLSG